MRPLTIVLAAVLLARAADAAPVDVLVDSCGQVVPPKAHAHLAADLDCSAYAGNVAVTLGKKATLDLGGYTFTTGGSSGLDCSAGRCTIRNGTVQGSATFGIVAVRSSIESVAVHHGGLGAVSVDKSTIRDATISGTALIGVHGNSKVKIAGSTITGHAIFGVWVPRVQLVDSTVTGNMTDPECSTGATCADVMASKRPRLKRSTCGRSQTLPTDPFAGCLGWCVCSDD